MSLRLTLHIQTPIMVCPSLSSKWRDIAIQRNVSRKLLSSTKGILWLNSITFYTLGQCATKRLVIRINASVTTQVLKWSSKETWIRTWSSIFSEYYSSLFRRIERWSTTSLKTSMNWWSFITIVHLLRTIQKHMFRSFVLPKRSHPHGNLTFKSTSTSFTTIFKRNRSSRD